jgi:hypothetical protein
MNAIPINLLQSRVPQDLLKREHVAVIDQIARGKRFGG